MMTREWMVTGLREGFHFSGQERYDIAAQLQADGETIARLEAANAVLHERLEDNRFYTADGDRIEAEPGSIPDGIECRDDSIKILDENVRRLTAARDAAISALAEECRKRGTAEAIIADMLRLDHDGSEEEWRAVCVRARAVLRPADGDAT